MNTLSNTLVKWWKKEPYAWGSEWRKQRASHILPLSLGFFYLSAACMAIDRWAGLPEWELLVTGVEGFAMGIAIGLAFYWMGLLAEDKAARL